MCWIPADATTSGSGRFSVGATPIFGAVTADAILGEPLREAGWEPLLPVTDVTKRSHASVWRDQNGSILLPFDPDQVIANFWSERFGTLGSPSLTTTMSGLARRGYYRLRPLLPRQLQIRSRQLFSRVQQRAPFPRWPVEPALHDVYELLFDVMATVVGERIPHVSIWPHGHSWALVLTHDVETAVGYDNLHRLRDLELSLGLRSSWNFVPRRYDVDDRVVHELQNDGFEVGVHGLYHDGRDLADLRTFRERLPAIRGYARRWNAVGYRSPAMHRVWEWMPELPFTYDSSYPDTDPYQPIPGGCCSLLPFHIGPLVEIPLTMPQDFVMFDLLQQTDEALWTEKLQHVRRYGGMAVILTHPDYMLDDRRQAAYERFLDSVRDEAGVWHALPSKVAAWWRRRAMSSVQRVDGAWRVVGPADGEAHVAFSGVPAALSESRGASARWQTPDGHFGSQ